MYEVFERLCKENGVTAYKVCKATGITTATISNWKAGRYTPKADKMQKIADYFGVSLEYLTTGKNEKLSPEYIADQTLKDSMLNSVDRVIAICKERKIPISRLEKDLGYANGYIGQLKKGVFPADRLSAIANYLNVSSDFLLTGKEGDSAEPQLTKKDQKDIKEILANTEQLLKQDGLMFDGDPASPEAIDSILSAMQVGMELAKKKNKEKYTPKKYKKD